MPTSSGPIVTEHPSVHYFLIREGPALGVRTHFQFEGLAEHCPLHEALLPFGVDYD